MHAKVFVKSSTGFFKTEEGKPNGATFEAMELIVENAKPLPAKAAGGVRNYEDAVKMVENGSNTNWNFFSKINCRWRKS